MTPTNNTSILRTALYIRVSSDEQAKNGDSLRDQKESGLDYINRRPDTILQDIYIDDGVSGQKLNRDDFQRLMENVRNNQVDLIIFTKLDRWFRSLRHYLNTQAMLEEHHVSWLAITQPYFDTSTPYGRAFVSQSMTWAELEAQNGGIRVRDVFASKVKNKEVITGKVPRGYRIENKHLVLSSEAPAVYDGFQYFLKTHSIGRTLIYLNEQHGIVMTLNNLRMSILENEKYTGRYRGIEDYCPRIISDEMFQEVQSILQQNKNIKTNQRYTYIFSGILFCGECGHKLSSFQICSHRGERKYRYPAYHCKNHSKNKFCSNTLEIRETKIEKYLLENVREEMEKYSVIYSSEKKNVIDNRLKKANLRKKMERLKDLYLNEAISLDEFKQDRAALQKQLDELPDMIEPTQDFSKIRELLNSNFEEIYTSLSNEEKRLFWRAIIKEIHIRRNAAMEREYRIVFH